MNTLSKLQDKWESYNKWLHEDLIDADFCYFLRMNNYRSANGYLGYLNTESNIYRILIEADYDHN
jgi:hypothetical protein